MLSFQKLLLQTNQTARKYQAMKPQQGIPIIQKILLQKKQKTGDEGSIANGPDL